MISSLWRTERPRFPMYAPDGRGRDYYIKYTNGGYWENQFQIKKNPDFERPHYTYFHSLIHPAAPFKYWGNGNGRETYILKTNGLFHDQKPLCSYKLSDFLREKVYTKFDKKKIYMSVSEKKFNKQLKKIEKKLVQRLYTEPMSLKKSLHKNRNENYSMNYEQFANNFCQTENNFFNEKKNGGGEKNFCKTMNNFHGQRVNTDVDMDYNTITKKFKKVLDYSKMNTTPNRNNFKRFTDIGDKDKNNKEMKVMFKFKSPAVRNHNAAAARDRMLNY